MRNDLSRILATTLALWGLLAVPVSAAPPADAEPLSPCILGDDGFDSGCCTEPVPFLPSFPAITTTGKYACYSFCGLQDEQFVSITLDAPVFIECDTATIKVTIKPLLLPSLPTLSGRVLAKYSRTWELRGNGIQQIWRFLLNGDLKVADDVAVTGSCPVPPLDATAKEHFVGHIDYTCDPSQQHVDLLLDSLSLHHLPGCISHGPSSARPRTGAAAHYDNSYHIVAPANFTFGTTGGSGPVGGFVAGESVRPSALGACFPSTYSCLGEAEVQGGEYFSANCDVCVCSSFPCTGPWRHYGMSIPVDCNGNTQILQGADGVYPIAPEGLIGMQVGFWSGGTAPLGSTDLFVKFGALTYDNPCIAVTNAKRTDHTVFGVATRSVPGSDPQLYGGNLGGAGIDNFIDLQNSLIPGPTAITPGNATFSPAAPGGAALPAPAPPCIKLNDGFGAPAYADLVFQLNT